MRPSSTAGLRFRFLVGQPSSSRDFAFRVRLTLFYNCPRNLGQRILTLERLLMVVGAAFTPRSFQETLEYRRACINTPSLTQTQETPFRRCEPRETPRLGALSNPALVMDEVDSAIGQSGVRPSPWSIGVTECATEIRRRGRVRLSGDVHVVHTSRPSTSIERFLKQKNAVGIDCDR